MNNDPHADDGGTDPGISGGERTVLNPSEGGLAFLGENMFTLFTIFLPTLACFLVLARVFEPFKLLIYAAGTVYFLASSTFLFSKYDWMTNRGYVAMITRFYTQPAEMLYDRFPEKSGIEQPERQNIAAKLSRTAPFKYLPVFGAEADEENRNFRPQDLVPLKRPFRDSPAIESERDDRRTGRRGTVKTVVGFIRIEPPNIVTDDKDSWKRSAKWFAAALDSTFTGNSQLYEPMRSANYEPRVYRYRAREQQLRHRDRFDPAENENADEEEIAKKLTLADYAQERGDNVSLRDITALVRDYYVVHEVTPEDVVDTRDIAGGGIASVPGIGYMYTEYKIWKLSKSDEYIEQMAETLEDRLKKMSDSLENITGLRCSIVPSEHASQAVADHYNAANMYATANFRDLIRQSPQSRSYNKRNELSDILDNVPDGFENPEDIDETLSPELRRLLDLDDPAEGAQAQADVHGNSLPDEGAEGMAEYGAAWDHMADHPMARSGVIHGSDIEDAGYAAADGGSTTASESNVDRLVAENGGPVDFDIVQDYESEEFTEWYRSLLCAEDTVNRRDPNYLVIDDQQFAATLMITRWPPDIDPGFLEPILRFEDPRVAVSMSTHIHSVDQNALEMELADEEDEHASKVEKVAGSRFPVFLERFKEQHKATKEMLQSVTRSDHDTFETQTYLEVRAHTPRSLYKSIDRIKNRLRSEGAAATLLKHNHEKGHQTVAPICDDQINHGVKMRSDGLGCLNPWTVRNLYDSTGVEVGENMAANEPLAFDFWKRTLAPHFGIWTESGGGKTTLATIMFNRLLTLYPDDFFLGIIDPLQEFVNLAELHGGHRIVLGGDDGMNPLHGSPTPEDKLSVVGKETPFSEWKEGGLDFLALYYDALDIEFTAAKRTVWSKAIAIIAEEYGITKDPYSLDPEVRKTNGFSGDWPTLRDAAEVIGEMSDDSADERFVRNPDNEKQVEDRERVATDIINNDVDPLMPGGEYAHFGKENEVEIPDDANLVYVDSQLSEGDMKAGLEMHVILDLLYDHAKTIAEQAGIFCDEFHYLLRDDTVMESLNHKFRHGRHWDLWIGVASQSYRDLFGADKDGKVHLTDNAEVMFENMSAQFYLHNDIDYKWSKKLGLSREETKFVNEARVGECLLRVQGVGTYPLEIILDIEENPRETVIAEYDPSKHGENFLAYLEQHRDICEWSFAPVDIEGAPDAEIGARNEIDEDDFDPYAAVPTAGMGDD